MTIFKQNFWSKPAAAPWTKRMNISGGGGGGQEQAWPWSAAGNRADGAAARPGHQPSNEPDTSAERLPRRTTHGEDGKSKSSQTMKSDLDSDYPKTTFRHLEAVFASSVPLSPPPAPPGGDVLFVPVAFGEDSGSSSDDASESLSPLHRPSQTFASRLTPAKFLAATKRVLCPTKEDLENDILRLTLASDLLNPSHTSEEDFHSLCEAIERLRTSGWYYENVTRHQVKILLKDKSTGSFLIRDSTDPRHLFALSVRTPRGTTNVRIEYDNGQFRLDCEDCLRSHMPVFSCIVKLVNFYIQMGKNESLNNPCVWLETSGKRDMPVKLTKPLHKNVSSLKHLSRKSICGSLSSSSQWSSNSPSASLIAASNCHAIDELPLPNSLIAYLKWYPYAN